MSKPLQDTLSESEGSEGWDDVDDGGDNDEESLEIVSLLDDKVFPDAASMLAHCKDKFNFDFVATRDRLGLDFYGSIKLVNFIRSTAKGGNPLPENISEADIQDDRFLMPVLTDDALIMCLDDLPSSSNSTEGKGEASATAAADAATALQPSGASSDLASKNATLEAQLEELTKQFANYRVAVEQTLDKRWLAEDDDSSSTSSAAGPSKKEEKDSSKYYWEGYAHHEIHETMLKDTVRTDAYRDFIYNNKHLFKGKTVLDIGCGTGILSMFCAKAGAAHVYAIDKSAILDKARENVFHNNLSDKITCLRGRVEDIVLPVAQVDIIVSEWMGYCLLYEAMLPSVLFARDRYLKPDTGLLIPSQATIFVAPTSDPEYVGESVTFWRDVYGFDMKPMLEGLVRDVRVQYVPRAAVCGTPAAYALDLYRCRVEDLSFRVRWNSKLTRDLDEGAGVDGFLIWFDNYFATTRRSGGDQGPELIEEPAEEWQASQRGGAGSIAFSTGPHAKDTHWKQGFLMIEDSSKEGKGKEDNGGKGVCKAGEEMEGYLTFAVADVNARGLEIKVEWEGLPNAEKAQSWALH